MTNGKQVYAFQEGSAKMKALLGGKGANLAEMTRAGLPVPPGFTITTEACLRYFEQGGSLTEALKQETADALKKLELVKNQQFGSSTAPLLVSVRSGSVSSMPGMMDTILNLGLNDETVAGLAALTGNPRFAYDCYRRLIAMFGNVVLGIEGHYFEQRLNKLKNALGVRLDQDVPDYGWQRLVEEFKAICASRSERAFPQDVHEQLYMAIEAVFGSWNNSRAQIYRRINRIPDNQGTAVNIQSMVFGNRGTDSGTGVIFTRNPSTGEARLYGEYLMNAQGEDVVAGVRTPLSISAMDGEQPELYAQLASVAQQLERHYRDMQDIEFTVETGKLYLLQTRNGKRNAQAALRIAVEFVREGLLTRAEALERIEPSHLDQLLHRGLDEQAVEAVLAVGLPASPGAAAGQLTFDADTAAQWHREGRPVILARPETTPEDIHGVLASEGVLTSRGGMTSHAAVVARGMGKPCVCGCESLRIDVKAGTMEAGGIVVREGDWITLDGASGRVIVGNVPLREPETSAELLEILGWADEVRRLRVMTNADNPHDARVARAFGAEGIGLCRTEHMFFAPDRLPVMQAMILAETDAARRSALDLLLPMQQSDFAGMFREMDGLPVTIRLLDPPLHEFLPSAADLQQRLQQLGAIAGSGAGEGAGQFAGQATETANERRELSALLRKVNALHESNPMLGQRGCRLGIVFPEIYDMQIEAIFRAVAECSEDGVAVLPEIMIPLVGHVNELSFLRGRIDGMALQLLGEEKLKACRYKVGTMIEVPRAALTARQIAAHADFFSFGTNDLTQMTFGYSRDDAEGKFLSHYIDRKLLAENPFQVLDTEGVGQLIEMASVAGRAVNPRLKTGICGEHGGDKSSIFFCHQAGLDYVSCSPYRVPLARIAAAQAAIALGNEGAEGWKQEA